jgi:carbon monoxide dehydrogenase subunit G
VKTLSPSQIELGVIVPAVSSQSFSHAATTTAPPAKVWDALQRPETWGSIGGVKQVERPLFDPEGNLTGYDFAVEIGGIDYSGRAFRTAVERERSMVMAIDSTQMTGSIAIDLAPVDVGTRVRVEIGMTPNGFIATMAFPLIIRAVAGGFEETVEDFVAAVG